MKKNNDEKMKKSVKEVTQAIEEIDKMIAVVRDISTKTDLLALNASIEAARAGQAGKGFAIVAHEVARLSEKAQESINAVESACANLKSNFSTLAGEIDVASSEEKPSLKAA